VELDTSKPLERRVWGDPSRFAVKFEPGSDPKVWGGLHGGEVWYAIGGRWFQGDRQDSVCCAWGDLCTVVDRGYSGLLDQHRELFNLPARMFVRAMSNALGWRPAWTEDERDTWMSIGYCHQFLTTLYDEPRGAGRRGAYWEAYAVRRGSDVRLACCRMYERPRNRERFLVGQPIDVVIAWSEIEAVAREYYTFYMTTPLDQGWERPSKSGGEIEYQARVPRESYDGPELPAGWVQSKMAARPRDAKR